MTVLLIVSQAQRQTAALSSIQDFPGNVIPTQVPVNPNVADF
jgi:hypothetical protein